MHSYITLRSVEVWLGAAARAESIVQRWFHVSGTCEAAAGDEDLGLTASARWLAARCVSGARDLSLMLTN
jgi:hypothetical protein